VLIEDGTGSGRTAKVDSENKLVVRATTETEIHHINREESEAYEVYFGISPNSSNPSVDSTQYFAYIKNTSNDGLVIAEMRVWVEQAEYIDIYFNTIGSPIGTTDITPVNMNLASGHTANGDFKQGLDITGLSGGVFFDRIRIPADDDDHIRSWPSLILIPKNNIVTFQAGSGGIPIELSIAFYYEIIN